MRLIILLLLFSSCLSAQEALIQPQAAKQILSAVSEDNRVIVGERGHVFIYANQQLMQQPNVTKSFLTNVTWHKNTYWAVGHDLTIINSQDGSHWQTLMQAPEQDKPFFDITFLSNDEGLAVGAYGAFYRTVDAGNTWRPELHASFLPAEEVDYLQEIREFDGEDIYLEELSAILPHLNAIHSHQDDVYVVGEMGLVAVSKDKGHNWSRMSLPYAGSFFALASSESGLLVGGLRANLWWYAFASKTWQAIPLCVTDNINYIRHLGEERFLIAGNNGLNAYLDLQHIPKDCSDPNVVVRHLPSKQSILAIDQHKQQLLTNQGLIEFSFDSLMEAKDAHH